MMDSASLALVCTGVWMMGITRLRTSIQIYSIQTSLLGIMALALGWLQHEATVALAGLLFLLLKGLAIPVYLARTLEKIGVRRDDGLGIAPPLLMLLTTLGLGALMVTRPLSPGPMVPALSLLLIGLLQMLARRLAVSQIVGFLVLENGIFLYTVNQPHPMPVLIELGVLLEILVWTMMAGILTFRIRDSFEHIDVTALRELHE